MRETRVALLAHLGGSPSATQRALVERAVQLTLRISMMDRKFAETGIQTELDSRTYLAWSGGLSRVLRDLGMKGVAEASADPCGNSRLSELAGCRVNILADLDNPSLFKPHFRGGAASWAAWRTFLAALFALPMDDTVLAAYRHHTGRQTPPAAPFKEAALICGRRGGKSRVLALIAVELALVDYSEFLAPGEVASIPIIAADRRQARTIFRYVLGLLNNTPALASLKGAETADSVEVGSSVLIEIHTASYRSVRGYTLAAMLIDEVAFLRSDETSANPDEEILAAVRPGLSSIPSSVLLIASSPYAKRGALYAAFRKHWAKDDARVLVWRGTTLEMNPTIDPAVITEAYEDDPQRAAAEYGAEFRNDIAAFVAREVIDACTFPGRHELPPITGTRYTAFVDPSGGSADSMTLAIAHRDGEKAVLDAVREIKPPFSPEGVVLDFCTLLKSYRCTKVTGDRYAGEWPREQFRKQGIEYLLSDKPKSDIYRDLLPILNSGKAELLDLSRLHSQLCGLERRTARGGRDSIDHPPAAHDDLANSVAGALLMVGKNRGFDTTYSFVGDPEAVENMVFFGMR